MENIVNRRINSIVRKYEISKDYCKNHQLNDDQNLLHMHYEYYRDVEIAFYSLNKKERFIFENTFMNHRNNRLWWVTFFNQAEFNNIYTNAVEKFLKKFYEIR